MRILITGASGFIGSHISEKLAHYDQIHLQSDLRDHAAVRNEVLEAQPNIIVHLAARTEVEKSFYEQAVFSDVNYTGTVNLIEVANELTDLHQFIFASTMEVYGWQPISDTIKNSDPDSKYITNLKIDMPWFTEETIPHPNAPYAVAKYGCEKYLEYASRAYNFPYTIIRQTNAYGRKDNDFFIVEQTITQMLNNPTDIYLGYDKPFRNFLYIDDLLDAWVAVINNPVAIGKMYCLGPNNAIQISELVSMIAEKLSWKGTVQWGTKPARPGEIYLLNSSADKITADLGWSPKVDLSTGLDKTIEHWRKKTG